MRLRISFYVLVVALVVGIFVIPKVSYALSKEIPFPVLVNSLSYTGLSWDNPKTHTRIAMKDGGTYIVPFGIEGDAQVGVVDSSQYWEVGGSLYYVSATSSERVLVKRLDGQVLVPVSWSRAGKYELDLYAYPSPVLVVAPWWRRDFAFLIGNTAYAADFSMKLIPITKIHFTIKKEKVPCVSARTCADNVLFIPGTEASRLYYRDGFGFTHQVWEPDWHTDIPYLAMNSDGTSKYKLYTKDIIGSIEAHNPLESKIAKMFNKNLQVYDKFENFLNGLVASSTIKEWTAYPYDWRYDVRDVVKDGTLTELPNGSIQRVYLADVLKRLASTSKTGKVTIVAHSNGGLIAKALVQYLGANAPKYIDRIVMVGTPQWGTPSSIGVMLHGDGETMLGGLVMNGLETRTVIDEMPDAYDLLPSTAYFAHISNPVVSFKQDSNLLRKFVARFGKTITSFDTLSDFLDNSAGLDVQTGGKNDLRAIAPLSAELISKAKATHSALDAWTPPSGISLTAIAGWGQDTVKTLLYKTAHKTVCNMLTAGPLMMPCTSVAYFEHTATTTQDGDGTVVASSAVGSTKNKFYFNSALFRKKFGKKIVHRNLLVANPIHQVIKRLLRGKKIVINNLITTSTPPSNVIPIKIRISTHSPVNVLVTNANGAQSGVLSIPGTDFSGIKRDILNGAVHVFDDEEYVTVPKNSTYHIRVTGYAKGSATLQIETIKSNGDATTTALFTDIPTTGSSTISFTETNGISSAPTVDLNGDGKIDFTVASSAPGASPTAYVQYMKSVVDALGLSKGVQYMIDARLLSIKRDITFYKKWFGKTATHNKYRRRFVSLHRQNLLMIQPQINSLEHFVEWQFRLSAKLAIQSMWHYRYIHKGISANQAEIIIDMINQLKSLL